MRIRPTTVARAVAVGVVASRLAKGATMRAPVQVGPVAADATSDSISIVIPARDEARRIGPLLAAAAALRGVDEVIVVDDRSTDDTAAVALAAGAEVVSGAPRPPGWAGKTWALQQGIEAATGEWVVALDADTVPHPELARALVARARADSTDLLSVGASFDCPTAGARWLHPAMLTTIVYRFGPPGQAARPAPDRTLANGQCLAFRRAALLDAGGLAPVAGSIVEDVALARHLARHGWRVDFLDGCDLVTVRMYESFGETWSGWGRSLGLPGLDPVRRRALDVVLLMLAMALPVMRLLGRRIDAVDVAALAIRFGALAGTARAYRRRGPAFWASPLADPVAVAALAASLTTRRQVWRGRVYEQ